MCKIKRWNEKPGDVLKKEANETPEFYANSKMLCC